MLIQYNPTISGANVKAVLHDSAVRQELDDNNISEENRHNLVKAILIVGTRDLELNIDEIIKSKLQKAIQS